MAPRKRKGAAKKAEKGSSGKKGRKDNDDSQGKARRKKEEVTTGQILLPLLIMGISLLILRIVKSLELGKIIKYTDDVSPCRLVGEKQMVGTEDIVHFRDGEITTKLVSSFFIN